MAKKSIAIVGYGYVGKAFANMVKDHYDTWVIDPIVPEVLPEGIFYAGQPDDPQTWENVKDAALGVICVPTPSQDDGSCDTSIAEDGISKLQTPVILVKSTVTPGTTDKLKAKFGKRIVMSPEYIGEGKYRVTPRMDFQRDMGATPFLIMGGDQEDCSYVFNLLVPILGPEKTYYQCSSLEAEVIKYMENTYFATKITFAQEMYEICRALGADWYKVWQGWSLDPRVDVMHTAVFPDARGFSGKCLPKDTNALVMASIKAGYAPEFLMEMIRSNSRFRPDEPPRFKDDRGN